MIYIAYLLLGICAGLLAGAFGVGGGIIIVPALIVIFKHPSQIAIGTSLMVIIAASITGTIKHWSLSNIDVPIAIVIAVGAVVGAWLGAPLLENVSDLQAKRILAVLLGLIAIQLWFSR
ncbi:sulfite exporter TauE/SafE family protein [candidate division KSB1 bacterium]|nr:sulfite exporter TauE/SafE family protein [candidate division KSB1 bacterium]